MKNITLFFVFATVLQVCGCTSPEYVEKWKTIRDPEQAIADFRNGEAIIYTDGGEGGRLIGLENCREGILDEFPKEYLGPVLPSNSYFKASSYNYEIYSLSLIEKYGEYMVRPGDTFSEVARKFDLSLRELLELNPDFNPQLIQIGQKLKIR